MYVLPLCFASPYIPTQLKRERNELYATIALQKSVFLTKINYKPIVIILFKYVYDGSYGRLEYVDKPIINHEIPLKLSRLKRCSYLDKQLVFYFHSSLHILLRILNGETKKKTRINKNANLLIIIIATFMKLIRQDAISSHFSSFFSTTSGA